MRKPDSNPSALQRVVDRMREEGMTLPGFMRKVQDALKGSGSMGEKAKEQIIADFDAVVAEVLRTQHDAPLRAPAARPSAIRKPAKKAEKDWKALEAELEQELIRKFNL